MIHCSPGMAVCLLASSDIATSPSTEPQMMVTGLEDVWHEPRVGEPFAAGGFLQCSGYASSGGTWVVHVSILRLRTRFPSIQCIPRWGGPRVARVGEPLVRQVPGDGGPPDRLLDMINNTHSYVAGSKLYLYI